MRSGKLSESAGLTSGSRLPFGSCMPSGEQEFVGVDYAFSLAVETHVEAGVGTRRFRWRLKAPGASDFPSTQTFATKREAMKDGEAALDRARQRGRLRP